jgi:hypothetical protein
VCSDVAPPVTARRRVGRCSPSPRVNRGMDWAAPTSPRSTSPRRSPDLDGAAPAPRDRRRRREAAGESETEETG